MSCRRWREPSGHLFSCFLTFFGGNVGKLCKRVFLSVTHMRENCFLPQKYFLAIHTMKNGDKKVHCPFSSSLIPSIQTDQTKSRRLHFWFWWSWVGWKLVLKFSNFYVIFRIFSKKKNNWRLWHHLQFGAPHNHWIVGKSIFLNIPLVPVLIFLILDWTIL